MLKKIALVIAGSLVTVSAFALDSSVVEKTIDLRDGSTVHVFLDGNMGMEDKYGRVVGMDEGQAMSAKNGEKVIMKGNETARLYQVLRPQYQY